jgi:oligosaccharide 4-alpha-D-glucosyltransferase
MKYFFFCFCLIFFSQFVFSQNVPHTNTGTAFVMKSNGTWSFQQYAPNVFKVVFQPKDYTTNENVSGAVIEKPQATSWKQILVTKDSSRKIEWKNFSVYINGDTVYLGNDKRAAMIGYQQNDHFRGFKFLLHDSEKIFGAGERALPLNRRGYRFDLYNNPHYGYSEGAENLNYSVPFITSSDHYALFFDNASKGYLDIGKNDTKILEYGAYSGELNFYIITGNDYPELLQSYHKLTGTQPLPPRWALGCFMSRFGYSSDADARNIYAKMRNDSVPFDAVIFDLYWFGDSIKHTLGNLDWINKTKWPHPKKMISDFKKDNVNTILITEPFALEGTKNYDAFKPFLATDSSGKMYMLTDFYFGRGGLIDMFRNDSKNFFWSFYKKQMGIGVEGWWGDLGEPEKHPSDLYHNLKDFGYKRLFSADEVHNVYGHNWTKMLYDKYTKEYPDKRLFSLNRSGFAGTQRFGIFPWSGDVSRSWKGLRTQLPLMLGMSMSGVPYIHADAGGFAGGDGDNELYVRWLQYAAFTPIFRPHGTVSSSEPISKSNFPSEIALIDTPYKNIARNADIERYKLLPYNYTLSYEQAVSGEPLVSPLYYYFSDDMNAVNVNDEFMRGHEILVAPVLEKNATTRKLYLPKGEWYNFYSDEKIAGEKWVDENVDLNHIPVFIKAGSFVPMIDKKIIRTTKDCKTDSLIWNYYPSQKASSFTMYDDDGESKNSISAKHFELITSSVLYSNHIYHFHFSSNGGYFKGQPISRRIVLKMHGLSDKKTIEHVFKFIGKPVDINIPEE